MKKVTIELDQVDLFNIACLLMGYCLDKDAEPETSIIKLENVSILTKQMDETTLREFKNSLEQFKSNQSEITEQVRLSLEKINNMFNLI
jgi:quinolinate synthase